MQPPPCVEPGKRLNPCAVALHRERIEGYAHLPAEWWAGWRISRQFLIGPGGIRFTAASFRALAVIKRSAVADDGRLPESTATRPTTAAHGQMSEASA